MEVLKVCRYCGKEAITEEDLDGFSKNDNMKNGRGTVCKPCDSKRGIEYYEKNKKGQKDD